MVEKGREREKRLFLWDRKFHSDERSSLYIRLQKKNIKEEGKIVKIDIKSI